MKLQQLMGSRRSLIAGRANIHANRQFTGLASV